jgi:hypothetical protein
LDDIVENHEGIVLVISGQQETMNRLQCNDERLIGNTIDDRQELLETVRQGAQELNGQISNLGQGWLKC